MTTEREEAIKDEYLALLRENRALRRLVKKAVTHLLCCHSCNHAGCVMTRVALYSEMQKLTAPKRRGRK